MEHLHNETIIIQSKNDFDYLVRLRKIFLSVV